MINYTTFSRAFAAWQLSNLQNQRHTISAAPCADAASSASTSTPVISDPMVAPLRDTLLLALLDVMADSEPVVTSSCLPPTRAGWLLSWVTQMSAAPHDFNTCSTLHTSADMARQQASVNCHRRLQEQVACTSSTSHCYTPTGGTESHQNSTPAIAMLYLAPFFLPPTPPCHHFLLSLPYPLPSPSTPTWPLPQHRRRRWAHPAAAARGPVLC